MPLAFSVVLISVTLCVTEMKCPKPAFCRIFTMLHLCPFPCSLHGITDEQVPGGPTCPHYRHYTVPSLGEKIYCNFPLRNMNSYDSGAQFRSTSSYLLFLIKVCKTLTSNLSFWMITRAGGLTFLKIFTFFSYFNRIVGKGD